MNKNIIKACLNPGVEIENYIKECIIIEQREKIDKYLQKDEITYDGNVISAYDVDKILIDKMEYIIDMCDSNNYVINKAEVEKIFRRYFKYAYGPYIKINKDKSISVTFNHFLYNIRLDFDIFLKDNEISYKIRNYSHKKYNYEINPIYEFEYKTFIESSDDKVEKFIDNFINNNQKILLNLLTIINEFDRIDEYKQTIVVDDCKLYYVFDLLSLKAKTFLVVSNLISYNSKQSEDIMKRIIINIDELNPLFRNEIDKYYNSINSIEYKYYKKEKSL